MHDAYKISPDCSACIFRLRFGFMTLKCKVVITLSSHLESFCKQNIYSFYFSNCVMQFSQFNVMSENK